MKIAYKCGLCNNLEEIPEGQRNTNCPKCGYFYYWSNSQIVELIDWEKELLV